MAPPPTVTPSTQRLPPEKPGGSMPPAAVPRAAGQSARQHGAATAAAAPDDTLASVETSAAIGELVDALKTTSIGLRFEIDDATHRVITKVVDKETGELIRQMPTEEVLRIARAIDKLQGLFVSQVA